MGVFCEQLHRLGGSAGLDIASALDGGNWINTAEQWQVFKHWFLLSVAWYDSVRI
jgi:hypothetical protein